MPNFDSGVAYYITGRCTVEVNFPVDHKGNPDVSCNQCKFFRRQSRSCALNGEMCHYPENHIGAWCPLDIVGREDVR